MSNSSFAKYWKKKSSEIYWHKIPKKTISYDQHLKIYDGLPTKKKLEIFFNKKISKNKIEKINSVKQIQTAKLLKSNIKFNKTIFDIFKNFNKKK